MQPKPQPPSALSAIGAPANGAPAIGRAMGTASPAPQPTEPDPASALTAEPSAKEALVLASTPSPLAAAASTAVPLGHAPLFQPSFPPAQSALQAADPTLAVQIENAIDRIEALRETGRAGHSELTVRHAEFGPVSLRIEPVAGDLRAILSSRDPGFVQAIHTALIERAAEAGGAGLNGQAGQQSGQQSSSGRPSDGQFAWGQQHSGERYGSSPGSGQSAAQPYSRQEGEDTTGAASHIMDEDDGRNVGRSRAAGLYA
jgi:hypothetical protein